MKPKGEYDNMRTSQTKRIEGNDERGEFGKELTKASQVVFDIDKNGDVMIQVFDDVPLLKYVIYGSMVDWDISEYLEKGTD